MVATQRPWTQYGTWLAIGGETATLAVMLVPVRMATLPVMLVPLAHSDPPIAATLGILFLAPMRVALGAVARPLRR